MQPTVLIGLDGATFTVLDPAMRGGYMPRLAALLDGGARAELLTTPHPLTPPAWTTVLTGRGPGHHGIFDFLRSEIRKTGAFFTLNGYRDIECETLLGLVDRHGGRVTCVNFPLTNPPPKINGSVVPGLLSWRHLRRNIHPPGLFDELKSLPGFKAEEISWDFEHEKKAMQVIDDEELGPWTEFHLVRERHWHNIIRHLMQRHPADLTLVMFDGVDKLQHSCWRFLDPALAPARPTEFERKMHRLCLEYFQMLDQFLGEILELAGPETRVLLVSDHGFGPTQTVFRINKWLESEGYLRWKAPDAASELSRGGMKSSSSHFVLFDWSQTVAYAQSPATNGIHLRMAEAPGEPGVAPERYDAVREEIIAKLKALRDPASGKPLVQDVLKREVAFPGPQMHKCPDLTLVLFDHSFVSVLDAEPIIWTRPQVAGTHYPVGVLMAHGPGIRKGAVLPRQSIFDVAPTLLYSLGLPVPCDFEGQVVQELFEPSYVRENPPQVGPATLPPHAAQAQDAAGDGQMDAEAEEQILNRLRALGYVE